MIFIKGANTMENFWKNICTYSLGLNDLNSLSLCVFKFL